MLVWGNSKIDKKITIKDFCLLNSHIEEEVLCKKTQCGFDSCSTDDKSCEDLNSWTMIIRKYTDKLTQMETRLIVRFNLNKWNRYNKAKQLFKIMI